MSDIRLSGEDALRFMHNMLHPDEEAIARRDAFFKEIDETLKIKHLDDGTVVLTSPDITLSEKDVEGL